MKHIDEERLRKEQEKRARQARQARTAARRAAQRIRLDEAVSWENYLAKQRRHTVLLAERAERMRRIAPMKQRKAARKGKPYDIRELAIQLDTD
jgi:hypothetical protein